MLMKRDDHPQGATLFNDIMLRKAEEPSDDDTIDDKKLSDKLDEIVAEMIVAAPSLHPQRARRWLLHTPQGQKLLAQHTTAKKKETPMLDITKLNNIDSVIEIAKNVIADKVALTEHQFTEILTGHAKLTGTTLEKILIGPNNGEIRKAYLVIKGYQPAG